MSIPPFFLKPGVTPDFDGGYAVPPQQPMPFFHVDGSGAAGTPGAAVDGGNSGDVEVFIDPTGGSVCL